MLKRYVSSLLVLTFLCGCMNQPTGEIIPVGSEMEDSNSDEYEMAVKLMEETDMKDSMTQITSRKMTGMLFDGDKSVINGGVLFLSSKEGNTDTVGVFTTDQLDKCRVNLSDYLADKKSEVEIYNPDETFKISNAIISDNGKDRIVMVVSPDIEKARKAVNGLLGIEN